ncbi:MAG: hypothetical protein IJO45_00880 [Oscillospiraceae bacterium]|nr:hypothetical protein [Oscillospiraceae bacterium]
MKRIIWYGISILCALIVFFFILIVCVSHRNNTTPYQLYINGKEYIVNSDLQINHDQWYAELPLLTVMDALGAEIVVEQGNVINTHMITITFNGYSFTFNTEEKDFGLEKVYWLDRSVRRMKDGELIIDSRSVSAMMYHAWNVDISIDYAESVVSIDTRDLSTPEEDLDMVNCRLIVNGTDITDGNYVRIDYANKSAELPVIAIAKELDANILWLPCKPYPIKESCVVKISFMEGCLELDTSKTDFRFSTNVESPAAVRKIIGNEIVMDSGSLQGLFFHGFKTNIRIDFDAAIVYIDTRRTVS